MTQSYKKITMHLTKKASVMEAFLVVFPEVLPYKVVFHKIFCNLYGIGGSTFSKVISNNPKIQRIGL